MPATGLSHRSTGANGGSIGGRFALARPRGGDEGKRDAMLPWKKRTTEVEPPDAEAESPAAEREADQALELVAEAFRALGEHAFSLDEIDAEAVRELFDAWSRHLLVGAPRPGADAEVDADADADADEGGGQATDAAGLRDWLGARRFVWGHRRDERDYVIRSLDNLREALWALIQAMGAAARDDRDTDSILTRQVERLQTAVDADSTDAIRKEAIAAVGVLGNVLADRDRRQRERLETLRDALADARNELESAKEKMEHDPLTDLFNRGALDEHLDRVASLGRLIDQPAWLFMVDLDHFKQVNDRYGHPMGDEVLRQVAGRIVRTFLRRDDFVARFGGEEFAVVAHTNEPSDVEVLGGRLLEAVRSLEVTHGGQSIGVTVSVGVAGLIPGEDAAAWLERADSALYRAKESGRDRLCVAPARGSDHPDRGIRS